MGNILKWAGMVLVTGLLAAGCGKTDENAPTTGGAAGDKVVIGFLVKQPEEQWFQDEWRFAQEAADKYNFELIKIGAIDGEKVLTGIDNLASKGAKGFIICTPDVKLGPSIVNAAKAKNMKLMAVDDQFVDSDGSIMDVHYMGISARNIGRAMGQGLWDEMQKRKWNIQEVGLLVPTWEQLDTARERTDGAIEALTQAGFPKGQITKSPQKSTDVQGGFDAANIAITQNPKVKRWLVCGMNDEAVLGAVRALEGRGFGVDEVIGIGIGGTETALSEFRKPTLTGFFGTVLISPKRHGFETAELMYKWITEGVEPPKTTLTDGYPINRENYEAIMKEQGLGG